MSTLPTYDEVLESGTNMLTCTEWVESSDLTLVDQYGRTRITLAGIEDLAGAGEGGYATLGGPNIFTGSNTFEANLNINSADNSGILLKKEGGQTWTLENGYTGKFGIKSDDGYVKFTVDNSGAYVSGAMRATLQPTADDHLCRRDYVLDQIAAAGGGTGDVSEAGTNDFTGLNSFSQPVTGVAPTVDLHMATKKYVDDNSAAGGGTVLAAADNQFTGHNNFATLTTFQDNIILDHDGFEMRGTTINSPSIKFGATDNAGDLFIASGVGGVGTLFLRPYGVDDNTNSSFFTPQGLVYMPHPYTDFVPINDTDLCNKAYVDANAGVGGTVSTINIATFIQGLMSNDETVMVFVGNETFSLPIGLTGSRAYCTTRPSASASIIIKKNGTTIATVQFSTASNVGTFFLNAETTFVVGDRLTLHNQSSADTTLADIAVNFMGDLI